MDSDSIVDRLSDLLEREVDSHDILEWTWVAEALKKFGITAHGISLTFGIRTVETSARTADVMRKEGARDPKGPQINPDVPGDLLLIGGFELARYLVRLLIGVAPESDLMTGRGSGYRADVAQLHRAGF